MERGQSLGHLHASSVRTLVVRVRVLPLRPLLELGVETGQWIRFWDEDPGTFHWTEAERRVVRGAGGRSPRHGACRGLLRCLRRSRVLSAREPESVRRRQSQKTKLRAASRVAPHCTSPVHVGSVGADKASSPEILPSRRKRSFPPPSPHVEGKVFRTRLSPTTCVFRGPDAGSRASFAVVIAASDVTPSWPFLRPLGVRLLCLLGTVTICLPPNAAELVASPSPFTRALRAAPNI